MTYTTTNTNPGLVSTSILDTSLTLSYTPSASGTATITARATDTTGLFVEDVFSVTVIAGGGCGGYTTGPGEDIDPTASIGDCTVIGHTFKAEENVIIGTNGMFGDEVTVKKNAMVGNFVTMGNKVTIEEQFQLEIMPTFQMILQ